jgi:hypothetical protein
VCGNCSYRLRASLLSPLMTRRRLRAAPKGKKSNTRSEPYPRLSPASQLPPELLSEIFLLCLSVGLYPTNEDTKSTLLLTHICAHWRSVALSTPSLWSRIRSDPSDLDAPQSQLQLVQHWLSHSGTRPLVLCISILPSEDNNYAVFDTILPHASRWMDVILCLPGRYCDLDPLRGNLGQLSKVYVVTYEIDEPYAPCEKLISCPSCVVTHNINASREGSPECLDPYALRRYPLVHRVLQLGQVGKTLAHRPVRCGGPRCLPIGPHYPPLCVCQTGPSS